MRILNEYFLFKAIKNRIDGRKEIINANNLFRRRCSFLTFDNQTDLSIFTIILWRRVINTSEYLNGLLNILKKTVHH